MRGRRLSILLGGSLLCFGGTLFAGTETESPRADNQAWGDPEERAEAAEAAEGWTWFGMGYENRVRSVDRSQGQAADHQGDAGSGGQGRPGRGGRN